jgi:hypothetical protein
MDHIRIIELIKKAAMLTKIPASDIHTGNTSIELTFIRSVLVRVLFDEGVSAATLASAFDRSAATIYKWLDRTSVYSGNVEFLRKQLLKP